MRNASNYRWLSLSTGLAACVLAAASASGLTIIPSFDASITGDPNGAAMMTAINAAISQEQSYILNPITVTIKFQSMTTGLGQSDTSFYTVPYSQYRSDLATHQALSASDITAL